MGALAKHFAADSRWKTCEPRGARLYGRHDFAGFEHRSDCSVVTGKKT
jgi:hypothetical protein